MHEDLFTPRCVELLETSVMRVSIVFTLRQAESQGLARNSSVDRNASAAPIFASQVLHHRICEFYLERCISLLV